MNKIIPLLLVVLILFINLIPLVTRLIVLSLSCITDNLWFFDKQLNEFINLTLVLWISKIESDVMLNLQFVFLFKLVIKSSIKV